MEQRKEYCPRCGFPLEAGPQSEPEGWNLNGALHCANCGYEIPADWYGEEERARGQMLNELQSLQYYMAEAPYSASWSEIAEEVARFARRHAKALGICDNDEEK